MHDVIFQDTKVNFLLLHHELAEALGISFVGLSMADAEVVVHLTVDTPEMDAHIRSVVSAHNPLALTPEQQLEANQQQALERLRAANSTVLDLDSYVQASPELHRLAEKIAWLELEIVARR